MIGRRRLFGLGLAATLASGGLSDLTGRLGSPAHADEGGEGHLNGQVVADDGSPLAGAMVTVISPELEAGDAMLTTDGDGRFALGPVRPGLYDVMVELDGYERGSLTTLRVQDGQATRAEIVLPRRASGAGY